MAETAATSEVAGQEQGANRDWQPDRNVSKAFDTAARTDLLWASVLVLALVVALIINPVGYIGGGLDDWQYLHAARCWREFGPCLPRDHWQARWPVIAPIALFTRQFGESRLTVSAMPLVESAACLLLIAMIGNRLFGRPVGCVAALLMLATPVFAVQMLQPSVEPVELGWILAGCLASLVWERRRAPHLAFLAGLSFSTAIQVRETAAISTAFMVVYLALRRPRAGVADLLLAGSGFALPFAIEFLTFWYTTGDPFWRQRLDLNHTHIPSSELRGPPDPSHSPFFNKAYIGNWKPAAGIHVHWAVDGLLNLFASAQSGVSLLLVPLFALLARFGRDTSIKAPMMLWFAAIAYACALIYAFAVDPKPRMMFVPLAMSNLALGLLSCRLFARRRAVVVASWSALFGISAVLLFAYPSDLIMERAAKGWIARYPDQIEIDENTRRHLTLLPGVASLAGVDENRAFLLYRSAEPCHRWIERNGLPGIFTVVAEAPSSRLAWLNDRLGPLCLLRYQRQVPGNAIRDAFRRSRDDGPFMVGARAI